MTVAQPIARQVALALLVLMIPVLVVLPIVASGAGNDDIGSWRWTLARSV